VRLDPTGETTQAAYTRTDASGKYSFEKVSAGDHILKEWVHQPSYQSVSPEVIQVTLPNDNTDVSGQDFINAATDRGPAQPEFLVNTTTAGSQSINGGNGPGRHAVAADAAGNFVVVWSGNGPKGTDTDGVFAQRYTAAGSKVGSEILVNATTAGGQGFASVAMDAAGDFVVIWQGPATKNAPVGFGDVKARVFRSDGSARGGEFLVSTKAFIQDVAMDAKGNFVVAYETPTGPVNEVLYAQRYNLAGSAQGKAINLNTTNIANNQANMAMDSDGDFVVAWDNAFQRVDRSGNKQGPVVPIPTSYYDPRPSVGMDAQGNFVVVWRSSTASPYIMQAQRYSANGNPVGPQFPVVDDPTDSTHQAGYPVVAMDAAGAFAITWLADTGSPYTDICVRRFDANGVGDQYVVANVTAVTIDLKQVAILSYPAAVMANGKLFVVWSGPGPGDVVDVFGQLYSYPDPPAMQSGGGPKSKHSKAEVLVAGELQPFVMETTHSSQGTGLAADQGAELGTATIQVGDLTAAYLGLGSAPAVWHEPLAAGVHETPAAIDALFSLSRFGPGLSPDAILAAGM
jgi:hypothetical protein